MKCGKRFQIRIGCVLACWIGSLLPAATIRVPEDESSIQRALELSASGDEVTVGPGVYELREPLIFFGRSITLRSTAGRDKTVLRMTFPREVSKASVIAFLVAEPRETVVQGFTISGGEGTARQARWSGGAIFYGEGAAARIVDCVIEDNRADEGGAIYCDRGSPDLENCIIRRNSASFQASAIALTPGSTLFMNRVTVSDHVQTSPFGAAVVCPQNTSARFADCVFARNTGGALHVDGALVTAFDTRFEDNVSENNSGAVFVETQTFRFERCQFLRNRGRTGGAVNSTVIPRSFGDQLASGAFESCTFTGNVSTFRGGALAIGEGSWPQTITGCEFRGNHGVFGGALYVDEEAPIDLRNSIFEGNRGEFGGAIYSSEGEATISRSTFVGNSSARGASSIDVLSGRFEIRDSIVWGNSGESISGSSVRVSHSCLEMDPLPNGEGNIDDDPRFAGWIGSEDVWVDEKSAPGGDGSQERPFRSLSEALTGFRAALRTSSPCIGSASDGGNMGADLPVVADTGVSSRSIHLAAGDYDASTLEFAYGVTLEGEGYRRTRLLGPVSGLRTGHALRAVTVRASRSTAIPIGTGESPRIENCLITGNVAEDASAIRCSEGSSPVIRHVTVTGNTTLSGSCVELFDSRATVENSIIWSNAGRSVALTAGSVTFRYSCVDLSVRVEGEGLVRDDPRFEGWPAADVYVSSGFGDDRNDGSEGMPFATLRRAVDDYSVALSPGSPCLTAAKDGGSIGVRDAVAIGAGTNRRTVHLGLGTYSLEGATFALNVSLRGIARNATLEGTVYGLRSGSVLERVTVTGEGRGLVISPGEGPTIRECSLLRNTGGSHGAAFYSSEGFPTIVNSTIAENYARREGAAVFVFGGTTTLVDCEILRNRSDGYGGAFAVFGGVLSVERCLVESNSATQAGAIYVANGRAEIERSILRGNEGGSNGVIHATNRASLTLENCLVVGNHNTAGHGIIFNNNGRIQLRHVTIADNFGRALDNLSELRMRVINCISYSNQARRGIDDSLGDDTQASLVGVDPQFVARGSFSRFRRQPIREGSRVMVPNFVTTEGDYRLQRASPAIDEGLEGTEVDLDGQPRPCGSGPDLGAYENNCEPPVDGPFVRGEVTGDGRVNLSDAVVTLSYLFLAGVEPSCLDAADSNDSGTIDLSDAIYTLAYLFNRGDTPGAPFPNCGVDPSSDRLTCHGEGECRD